MGFYMKGSFTIEAALVLPLILFSMAHTVSLGVELHQELVAAVERVSEVTEFNACELIAGLRIASGVKEAVFGAGGED